jgi:hypothetical protein
MKGTRVTVLSAVAFTGLAVLLGGCSNGTSSDVNSDVTTLSKSGAPAQQDSGGVAGGFADPNAVAPDAATNPQREVSGGTDTSLPSFPTDRKIIATAEMTLRSGDVASTVNTLQSIASSVGGYVSGQNLSADPDNQSKTRADMTLRVPTDKLDAVIDRVKNEGDVVSVTMDTQDVTRQVIDVNSRVASARASVERIRTLLSQANTLGEVVRIESELSQREADLESLLAEQRQLSDQTAMATLTVTVLGPQAVTPAAEDTTGFVPGLQRGWDALVDVVVVALTTIGLLLPFLVIVALVVGPITAAWYRRRRRQLLPPANGASAQERTPEPVG